MFYSIMTGALSLNSGVLVGTGYSGHGIHKNNVNSCSLKNLGPIPCGQYTMLPAPDNAKLGKLLIYLNPNLNNKMYGRNGFYIHGDDIQNPGEASHGCIIMSRDVRIFLLASQDKTLTVIP